MIAITRLVVRFKICYDSRGEELVEGLACQLVQTTLTKGVTPRKEPSDRHEERRVGWDRSLVIGFAWPCWTGPCRRETAREEIFLW